MPDGVSLTVAEGEGLALLGLGWVPQERAVRRSLTAAVGMTVILVEQHARLALGLTRQAVILERGRLVHAGPSDALAQDHATLDRCLGQAMSG